MNAGLEDDPGAAMAGSMTAFLVTLACLNDEEWEATRHPGSGWTSTQSTVKSKVGFGRCCIGLHGTALHVAWRTR